MRNEGIQQLYSHVPGRILSNFVENEIHLPERIEDSREKYLRITIRSKIKKILKETQRYLKYSKIFKTNDFIKFVKSKNFNWIDIFK